MFSHMMKTGGTSFNQHLKGCFGSKMNVVTKQNNLSVDAEPYLIKDFELDSKKISTLKVVSGHQVRPFVDFGVHEGSLVDDIYFRLLITDMFLIIFK